MLVSLVLGAFDPELPVMHREADVRGLVGRKETPLLNYFVGTEHQRLGHVDSYRMCLT
jgi:hypothetical protein